MKVVPQLLKLIKSQKTTIALSSGADSVAACHFLKKNFPKVDLQCFHFNHKLRPQNETMQEKAQEFCDFLQIPLIVKSRQPNKIRITEDSLRSYRYLSMKGLGLVATAHHLDDAVENYLYNCFNGVAEYLPIPLKTQYENCDLTIIRPFIYSDKKMILDYIDKNNLQNFVVEDETNCDTKYRRNWLRKDVVPLIQTNYNLKTIVRKKYKQYLENKKTNF